MPGNVGGEAVVRIAKEIFESVIRLVATILIVHANMDMMKEIESRFIIQCVEIVFSIF